MLDLPARIGKSHGYGGVTEKVDKTALSTALGLMLLDLEDVGSHHSGNKVKSNLDVGSTINKITGIFGKLRS